MNKQLQKIDELIGWLEQNAPEDACVMLLSMAEESAMTQESERQQSERKVELKTFIEGYDQEISWMLVKKMIDIPLLKQVVLESLAKVQIVPDLAAFDKWREKVKYDAKYELLDTSEEAVKVQQGEVAPYIAKIQEFCLWMNEKPSRNLTLLMLANDDLNSEKTTFAMGYAPDIAVMLGRELEDNYGLRGVVESSIFGVERQAPYEEYLDWIKTVKKK